MDDAIDALDLHAGDLVSHTREAPIMGLSYVQALVRRRRGASPSGVPRLVARAERWAPTRDALASYVSVCGLPERETLPITFAQLQVLRLQAALFAARAFPFSAPGIVHVDNTFRQLEPLRPDRIYGVTAALEGGVPHRSGIALQFRATVEEGPRALWESRSTYLVRSSRWAQEDAPRTPLPERPSAPADHEERLAIPESMGRDYARLGGSGDWNPIHVHALTARPFGFRRAIVHGMWTAARMLGAIADPLGDAPSHFRVAFGKPVFLPSEPTLRAWCEGESGAWQVRLEDTAGEKWHAIAQLGRGASVP